MSEQVGNFTSLVRRPAGSGGRAADDDLIAKSLVFISVGSNDLFEYADNLITEANVSSPTIRNDTAFLQGLIVSYTSNVKVLYMHHRHKDGEIIWGYRSKFSVKYNTNAKRRRSCTPPGRGDSAC